MPGSDSTVNAYLEHNPEYLKQLDLGDNEKHWTIPQVNSEARKTLITLLFTK
ncbi:hypothetical protein CHS0354_017028 [Potamilus streckersoni]|uniref:Uncharacterized protein n=1 Tax=Potamilus streckersoni TaxID=2493646 RepID=A0AAE0SYY5_9BIVA|nr:hypothetical protein CHS0354_017028 [Potamilus streckersoni]